MAEALYRKYRPQVFGDVVGQEHIERTIKNAIAQDKVSHAYLFCGPRGTGKTTTARLLAKALLCENGPTADPDGTCENCHEIARGEHPDVYELDAASRTGVENVREEIIGRVQFAPTRGRYKVYIIDEVHMLSTAAFNALLKTLEEPPDHVVFILCTTDPQKVPETIHSRCQRFDFHRISSEAIVARLGAICVAEDVEFEGDALDLIAYRAEGGMRNALTSLEQLIAFGEGRVTLELAERLLGSLEVNDMAEIVRAIGQRDIASCFQWTANYVDTGSDLAQFVRDLSQHIRNMYILSLAGNDVPLEISEAVRREMIAEMEFFGQDRLARLLGVLGDLAAELKTSSNPRLSFEIALTRMVRPDSDLTLESLAERIEALESGHNATAHVISTPQATQGNQAAPSASQPHGLSPHDSSQPHGLSPHDSSQPHGLSPHSPLSPHDSSQPHGLSPHEVGPSQAPATEGPTGQVSPAGQTPDSAPTTEPTPDPTPYSQQHTPHSMRGLADEQQDEPSCDTTEPQQTTPASTQPASTNPRADWTNPAVLQRTWQAVLAVIKKQKTAHGALFLNTRASFDQATQELVIEFPNGFAYTAAQKPDILDLVKETLAKEAGAPVAFRFVQRPADAAAEKPQAYGASAEVAVAAYPAARPEPQPEVQPEPQQRPISAEPAATPLDPASSAGSVAQAQPSSGVENAVQPQPSSGAEGAVQTQPAAGAGSVAQPQPEPQPAPEDDSVPLDLYDAAPPVDIAPPVDEVATPVQQAAPAQEAAPMQPAASTSADDLPEYLTENLSMVFGDGFNIEEVKED